MESLSRNISCNTEDNDPITSLTVVSSQCKSEEGGDGSHFKRGKKNTSLPLTPTTRTSSSSSKNIIRSLDDEPEVPSSGGIESAATTTRALNGEEESSANSSLVVDTCKVMTLYDHVPAYMCKNITLSSTNYFAIPCYALLLLACP